MEQISTNQQNWLCHRLFKQALITTLYICRVRTAHQPLKGQQATSYIAPQTAGDFFNGQSKTLDGQNLSSFSSALDRGLSRSVLDAGSLQNA